MRFRRYLGQEYRDKNNCFKKEKGLQTAVMATPIVTIYFLGYALDHTKAPVVRVNRKYTDAVTKKEIQKREDFIESLTHDSYVVQIPYLKQKQQSDLLSILSIFDQEQQTEDDHILRINENHYPEKYREIIRRLQKAIAEPEVRDTMDLEDEILADLQEKERTILQERAAREQAQAAQEQERIAKEQAQAAQKKAEAAQEQEHIAREKLQKELDLLRKKLGEDL